MNRLKPEKKERILSALVEGCSIRSIERMTGVHRDSIMRLLGRVGEGCSRLLEEKMRGLDLHSLQADEIWTFVGKKQKRVRPGDNGHVGDQYVYVAIDADTELVPCFAVGKRDVTTTNSFIMDLKRTLNGNRVHLTTDGYSPYVDAVRRAFGSEIDYGQIMKTYKTNPHAGRDRYRPADFVVLTPIVINGNPDAERMSTSYVERQNLTMRMQLRRFTRLTNGFSKKLENLKAALALHFAWYNFVRVHQSLKTTPAAAAGITHGPWKMSDLLEWEAAYPN